jgi:hypothetical protein
MLRNLCMITGLLGLIGPVVGFGGVTHIILVHPDGTFSPQRAEIRDGDTMEWRFSERTDSIIPIPDPAMFGSCQPHKPYDQSDPNEFTGKSVFKCSISRSGVLDTSGSNNVFPTVRSVHTRTKAIASTRLRLLNN